MNYNRSMTEYDEIVGAGIYHLLPAGLEKLRKANITAAAMATVLKADYSRSGAGYDKINVVGSARGIKIDLGRIFPDITDRDLLVKWSDVAKLIMDDDFYTLYIHSYKRANNPPAAVIDEHPAIDARPAEPSEVPQDAPALFDYSELPKNEADELRKIEQVIKTETASYFTILGANFKAAQELLANHSGGTFERWYTAVGFKRQTVYRLIQRYEFMCSPKLGEHRTDVFEELPLSLSCEISKPSAPPELVEQVLSGDITSHKEYQKLKQKLEKAESREKKLQTDLEVCRTNLGNVERNFEEREKLRIEAGKENTALRLKIQELENRPTEVVTEKQEVIPEGYVSPEEHREALDELEKRSKKLSGEIMRLKASQNAEKTGRLVSQIEDLDKQLHDQQSETKKAWGKVARAEYDAETKGIALEEARQKNAELEKQIAELKSAERPDAETAEKLFALYQREARAILTSFILFANAPENKAYKHKAVEVLESYLKTLQEDGNST